MWWGNSSIYCMIVQDKKNECLVYSAVRSKPLSTVEIQRCVSHVLKKLKIAGSLSIHCIGDIRMRKFNHQYRGKDKTTDVLSFSLREGELVHGDSHELGDIFISVPQITRQARALNISPREEFIRMLVHGILHILGHDHEDKKEAQIMFALQEKILGQLL